jgi:hypothetical protein
LKTLATIMTRMLMIVLQTTVPVAVATPEEMERSGICANAVGGGSEEDDVDGDVGAQFQVGAALTGVDNNMGQIGHGDVQVSRGHSGSRDRCLGCTPGGLQGW